MTRRLEDWKTYVSSLKALPRNLSRRPLNEECLKAEIRSTKASFPCRCLCDYVILTAVQKDPSAALGMTIRERDTPKKVESKDE